MLSDNNISSAAYLSITMGTLKTRGIDATSVFCKRGRGGRLSTTETITTCCRIPRCRFSLTRVVRCSGYSLLSRSARDVMRGDCNRRVTRGKTKGMSACIPFQGNLVVSITTDLTTNVCRRRRASVCINTRKSSTTKRTCTSYSPRFLGTVKRTITINACNGIRLIFPFTSGGGANIITRKLGLKAPCRLA